MNFPPGIPVEEEVDEIFIEALGIDANNVKGIHYDPETENLLIELEHEDHVQTLAPDYGKLKLLKHSKPLGGIIVTAASETEHDFVSRYFAPWVGIDEDPVTGSSHTVLAPYWMKKLGKSEFSAIQLSSRGGKMLVSIKDERIFITGEAVTVLRGTIFVK